MKTASCALLLAATLLHAASFEVASIKPASPDEAGISGEDGRNGPPESYIPPAKLRAIENHALNQCDALDGVKDGVIENPMACRLDLLPLLCRGAETNECLTQPQLDALAKIYAGPKTSSGQQVNPCFSPGGEAEPTGWNAWIDGARPESSMGYLLGTRFFKYMVYNDPNWDYRISTVDHNMSLADENSRMRRRWKIRGWSRVC